MKRSKISHKLAAAATVGMVAGASSDALAAVNFKTMSDNLVTASSGFQNLISTVCWLGGAGLGVAGIFKLKQHVDNPAQAPMKDALIRIAAGGGLLAFPFIQAAMQGSVADTDLAGVDGTVLLLKGADTMFK